jgi:hypothetical protein
MDTQMANVKIYNMTVYDRLMSMRAPVKYTIWDEDSFYGVGQTVLLRA